MPHLLALLDSIGAPAVRKPSAPIGSAASESGRDRALSRKLDLVTRSVSILMEALSARRSLHVEWAIFALILSEIILLV